MKMEVGYILIEQLRRTMRRVRLTEKDVTELMDLWEVLTGGVQGVKVGDVFNTDLHQVKIYDQGLLFKWHLGGNIALYLFKDDLKTLKANLEIYLGDKQ